MGEFQLSRRAMLAGSIAGGAALAAGAAKAAHPKGVYDRAIVIDGLGGPGGSKGGEIEENAPLTAQHVADAKASGVTAVNITVSDVGNKMDAFQNTVFNIAFHEREAETHPDAFLRIRKSADLKIAKETGSLGFIYGFQDLTPLMNDLSNLDVFHAFGLRISQLAYNRRNIAGDGCLEPANGGLSTFGREAVEKLNALKILIDGSHGGVKLIEEEIALSKVPMAVTHTGCRALNDVPRNIPDATMRKLAKKGGVMGVYFMPFLKAKGQPHAEDLLRHIDHALRVCGEDHVGLGTDGYLSGEKIDDPKFQEEHRKSVEERQKLGISAPGESADVYTVIPDYNDPRRFEKLAFDLARRGHSDRVVEKVLGGNFARLFAEVWG
jgi:membrane dipeptidase